VVDFPLSTCPITTRLHERIILTIIAFTHYSKIDCNPASDFAHQSGNVFCDLCINFPSDTADPNQSKVVICEKNCRFMNNSEVFLKNCTKSAKNNKQTVKTSKKTG